MKWGLVSSLATLACCLGVATTAAADGAPDLRATPTAGYVTIDNTPVPIQRPNTMAPRPAAPAQPAAPAPAPEAEPAPAPGPAPAPAPEAEPLASPDPIESAPRPRAEAKSEPRHDAGGLAATGERPRKGDRFPHKGTVADLRIGALGCFKAICRTGHDASPGFNVGGFLGGNIKGFVELGLTGGWGAMTPNVDTGTNVFTMYGLDPYALQAELLGPAAAVLPLSLGSLNVTGGTKLRSAQVGPVLRVHFVPRGRMAAFAGAGVTYNLFRSRYETEIGDVKLDYHGLAVPIEAGLGVHLHKNIALMAQFDYLWTWYGLAVLDNPIQRLALPVSTLDSAAQQQGVDLRGELPQFWTIGLGLRGRM